MIMKRKHEFFNRRWINESIQKVNEISRAFIEWHRHQVFERAQYLKTNVTLDLYNILAPEVNVLKLSLEKVISGIKVILNV